MNLALSPRVLPWLIAAVAGLVLVSVHVLQAYGWQPCELCLRQRIPFWVGGSLALCAGITALPRVGLDRASAVIMGLVAITFVIGAGLAVQHIGVEQQWWKSACSASGTGQIADMMNNVANQHIVSCDEKRPFLFGLTLATYNLFVSIGLAGAAASVPLRALAGRPEGTTS